MISIGCSVLVVACSSQAINDRKPAYVPTLLQKVSTATESTPPSTTLRPSQVGTKSFPSTVQRIAPTLATVTKSAPLYVWAVDAMTRVGRSDLPLRQRPIRLYAVRNEYEPFQLVVTARSQQLTAVRATASALRGVDGTIASIAITIYREHYVAVTQSSPLSPLPPTWIPDALIPTVDPATGQELSGALYDAQPFTVAAGENQPLWLDLYVPPTVAPGLYRGQITVVAAEADPVVVPIELVVGKGTLPVIPAQRSSFGLAPETLRDWYQIEPSAEPARYYQLWQQYGAILLDHRLMPTPLPAVDYDIDATTGAATLSGYTMPGLQLSPAENLALYLDKKGVNAIQISTTSVDLGQAKIDTERAVIIRRLGTIATLYRQRSGQQPLLYIYPVDEPKTANDYQIVREWAALLRETNARYDVDIQLLLTEQPEPERKSWGNLDGAVDIWVPCCDEVWRDMEAKSGQQLLGKQLAQGKAVWWYTALVQPPTEWMAAQGWPVHLYANYTPIWLIDYPPMNYRISSWINQHYEFTGLLYWSTTNWSMSPDIWHEAGTYSVGTRTVNGEGMLIYPGEIATVGFDGPIASMRLKWLRESMEDYDYIELLKINGKAAYARTVVNSVARAIDDWSMNPDMLYRARRQLGDQLSD